MELSGRIFHQAACGSMTWVMMCPNLGFSPSPHMQGNDGAWSPLLPPMWQN